MKRIYEVCLQCMDEPVERKQPPEDQECVNYCPKCGHKLEVALLGNKIDDTTYKIILNDTARLTDHMNRKNRFLKELMKMGNLTYEEALEKCTTKDSVIFEGDAKDIYLNLYLINGFPPDIHYITVTSGSGRFNTPSLLRKEKQNVT